MDITGIEILDYAGTAVFAISGALAAINKKFDLFGILIVAAVTAIGGGTLRDLLIGRTPVGWMQEINYIYIIMGATVFTFFFWNQIRLLSKTLFLFDSIGLALFTISGVELGLQYGIHPLICVFLGTLSASFGGVIRDILLNEVPLIFHKEIYASISIAGGVLFLILNAKEIPEVLAYSITGTVILLLRILAVKFKWELPRVEMKKS